MRPNDPNTLALLKAAKIDPFTTTLYQMKSGEASINNAARALFGIKAADVGKPLQDLELSYRPVDLRSLIPLDIDAIVASVEKTGRCVIVHEATLTSGFGAELAALVAERCFYALEAPISHPSTTPTSTW